MTHTKKSERKQKKSEKCVFFNNIGVQGHVCYFFHVNQLNVIFSLFLGVFVFFTIFSGFVSFFWIQPRADTNTWFFRKKRHFETNWRRDTKCAHEKSVHTCVSFWADFFRKWEKVRESERKWEKVRKSERNKWLTHKKSVKNIKKHENWIKSKKFVKTLCLAI